jgi:hypothetical protein
VEEQKELEQVSAQVVTEEEAASLCHEDDDDNEAELLKFRLQIATIIVSFVLFSAGAWQIFAGVATIKHWTYQEPIWLSDIIKMTVAAGLVVLGITSVQAINNLVDKFKK